MVCRLITTMVSGDLGIPSSPYAGQKPTANTPSTHRATNRAAQRAFRARKATHLRELEERLDQEKATHEEKECVLRNKAQSLELELQSFRSYQFQLQNMLETERGARIRAQTEARRLREKRDERCSRHVSTAGQFGAPSATSQKQNPLPTPMYSSLPVPSYPDIGRTILNDMDCPDNYICANEAMANSLGEQN